jgi:hypothetical protein
MKLVLVKHPFRITFIQCRKSLAVRSYQKLRCALPEYPSDYGRTKTRLFARQSSVPAKRKANGCEAHCLRWPARAGIRQVLTEANPTKSHSFTGMRLSRSLIERAVGAFRSVASARIFCRRRSPAPSTPPNAFFRLTGDRPGTDFDRP